MYSATGKDVLFLIFLFLQKRTCHTIYHHSMSQQALVYLKQVLWNLSSILFLVYKIKFYPVKYCGLGNTVNKIVLISFSWYHSPTEMTPVPAPTSGKVLSQDHNFQRLTGTAFSLVFFISTFAGVPISSTSQSVIIRSCCKIMKHLSLTGFPLDALFL